MNETGGTSNGGQVKSKTTPRRRKGVERCNYARARQMLWEPCENTPGEIAAATRYINRQDPYTRRHVLDLLGLLEETACSTTSS